MTDDSFILVNLKERESKKIAQVISNETSRKILDYLATKEDATESAMAKDLHIPLSTIHYNLQHLKKVRLVDVEEFHYSEKGKVVDHYKLANKFVIIAPRASTVDDIREQLGKILPVALVSVVGAFLVYIFGRMTFSGSANLAAESSQMVLDEVVREASPMLMAKTMDAATAEGAAVAQQFAPVVVQSAPDPLTIALWFLFGAVFSAVFIALFAWIRKKYNK